MTLTEHHTIAQDPLDLSRASLGQRWGEMNEIRLARALEVWELWCRWTLAHPGLSTHQFLLWLVRGQEATFSSNMYAYFQAGSALKAGWACRSVDSAAEIGRAIKAGLPAVDIQAHLDAGTLPEAIRQRKPQPDAGAREQARAAVREVSETDTLTDAEADTRAAAMFAALPRDVRAAAQRSLTTGQPFEDSVRAAVTEYFQAHTYLDWLHTRPCCVPGCGVGGRIEAHHLHLPSYPGSEAGRRNHEGLIPLCPYHHQQAPTAAHRSEQDAWSEALWGSSAAVYAVALDHSTAFLLSVGAFRRIS